MHLKSFRTYGFKSFADKAELTFDKGITAVVGPNGSGKSNISDAIRWVLGEQSAKYLRGSKMEDVIFSGSSKRKALGAAEVTLEFDNTDGSLPLDFENVSLSRRIFRSGESEYAINKKSCRLKDIIDLMADTGLGKGSMSIIGQNKIDEILNSRSEDRRGLFEEAAGIAKYRMRKKDAVKRLDDTEQNLLRINDICVEVDAQVEPLAEAAAKTRKYNALSEELKICRLYNLKTRLDAMASVKQDILARKQATQDDFSAKSAATASSLAEVTNLQHELDRLAEEYNQLQESISEQENALEKLRGKAAVLQERIAQSKTADARLAERNASLEQEVGKLEADMAALASEFDALEAAREKNATKVQELEEQRATTEANLQNAKAKLEQAQSNFFTDMQTMLSLRNELHALEDEQERRRRKRETLKLSIEEAEAVLASKQDAYLALTDKKDKLKIEMEYTDKYILEFGAKTKQAQEKLAVIQRKQNECQRNLTMVEAKEQTLRRLQANYEGFGYGIKSVLKAQEPWRAGVIGVTAELIQVEQAYITALETALGEGAQNIITDNAAIAKAAIAFLKRNGSGRATFLPLDTVQKRYPTAEEKRLIDMPGVCGYAVDLIKFDARIENAIYFLLGRVLIAENMDAALAAARAARFRVRVVTLAGDVINAGGSMSGGSRKQKEGYLTRESELVKIAESMKVLRKEMLALQEELEEVEEVYRDASTKFTENNKILQVQKNKVLEFDLQIKQIEQEKVKSNENLTLLYEDRKVVTDEYMANRTQVSELRAKVVEREGQDADAKAQLEVFNREIANLNTEFAVLNNNLHDAKLELDKAATQTQLKGERMRDLDRNALRLNADIASNEKEQERLRQVVSDSEAEKLLLQAEEIALKQNLQTTLSGKSDFVEKRAVLQNRQADVETFTKGLEQEKAQSEARLRACELEEARHDSDFEHLKVQLSEEYHLDVTETESFDFGEFVGWKLKDVQKKETSLNMQIVALGPINAAAVEEYETVRTRSEFLHKQYDDLREAKDNLETVIAEINSGMTKRFKEAFAQINVYFADCYAKLFGGGTAVLRLTDPENILDSGIDIDVQPPGKKLQSLFLMSGGERALTVIALLFALLSYRPSPFCILDEIDAPLDDANIARFSSFLREYASDTQFIIITHRKGTMEIADIMYGVTMEESGVSKLLSVKINAKEI